LISLHSFIQVIEIAKNNAFCHKYYISQGSVETLLRG